MAYTVNEKIQNLEPYQPIQGSCRIRLDANESFLQPQAELLAELGREAASVAFNRYPDPYAETLCRAFADFYHIDPADVVAGNGSDELISLLFSAFLMKGEPVMTLSPDFSMYRFYGGISEAQCLEYRKNSDFSMDVDALARSVQKNKVRMLIFSNPCNPTSIGLKREEIRRLVRAVDALVVLDEAYMDFWDQSLLGEERAFDNLIILRTCSKAAGMAALRVGFAVACPKLVRCLKAVKSPYNVNAVSQKIGAAVLSRTERLSFCRKQIIASRDALFMGLQQLEAEHPGKIHVYSTVTNFVTVAIPDSAAAYEKLLRAGIAVRCFDGFLRVTAGSLQENDEFLKTFAEILI